MSSERDEEPVVDFLFFLLLFLFLFLFLFCLFFLFSLFLALDVVVEDRCFLGPLKDFGKQDDLEDLLHDSHRGPNSEEDPVKEFGVFENGEQVHAPAVPVEEERSQNGDRLDISVNLSHVLSIEERYHEPGNTCRQIERHARKVAIFVLDRPRLVVEDGPEKGESTTHGEAVHTIEEDGLGRGPLTNEIVGNVLDGLSGVSSFDLSFTLFGHFDYRLAKFKL